MKAIYRGQVIAEADKTRVVEGNHYFPPDSLKEGYFRESSHRSTCFWKGEASYYDVLVGDEVNENAAWYYPETSAKAQPIQGMVAFWKGVEVVD